MFLPSLVVVFLASLAAANVYDCWDQEKLQRMQFKYSKGERKKNNCGGRRKKRERKFSSFA